MWITSRIPLLAATFSIELSMMLSGCSVSHFAVNRLGDALADGGSTFSADPDPELVAAAVPFSLKLMESLLAESPRHRGLLLASARGFTQYAYAFVQLEAERLESTDLAAAETGRRRARALYVRARDYALRGLAVRHRDFATLLATDPQAALRSTDRNDVALLYWSAVAWAAAIGLAKDEPDLVADLPLVSALIDRALALDESFDDGAIHSFLISYASARLDQAGDLEDRMRMHYERALALSNGRSAAAHLSWAESMCLPRQDRACFEQALHAALAIDVDAAPERRLANVLMQRRAEWLLGRVERLFLPPLPAEPEFPSVAASR